MNKYFYTFNYRLLTFFTGMFCLLAINKAVSQNPVLSLTPVISTGLSSPMQLVNAGDGTNRVFIVQKEGLIKVYDNSFNYIADFLTVTGITNTGERGLLSMAFHPDYSNNGFFFVYYTNALGNLEVARYHVSTNDANMADPTTKQVLITIPHPTNSNHNGGELHFGSDGFLYLSTGDGGGAGDQPNNAQNTSVLLGKMLRFNVNTSATAPFYTIPAGNPYNNEIFDLGLRNPFRWSFDMLTNDMWIGDVGQNSFEEINYRAAGSTGGVNYGWRCYEGNNTYNTSGCGPSSDYVFPVYTYATQDPSAAVTGGIVYRGTLYPALYGYYVAADFYSGVYYTVIPDGNGGFTTNTQTLSVTGIADFGETENGEAYAVSLTTNTVYRVEAADGAPVPVTLVNFKGGLMDNTVKLNWQTTQENNLEHFEVEYSLDGSSFTTAGNVTAQDITTGAVYNFTHVIGNSGPVFYRLKMVDEDGTYRYSPTIKILITEHNGNIVTPSLITNGIINVNLGNIKYNTVDLINQNGAVIFTRNIERQTGRISIPTGGMIPGVYLVRLSTNNSANTQKIVIQ